jgi:hypothetical protein
VGVVAGRHRAIVAGGSGASCGASIAAHPAPARFNAAGDEMGHQSGFVRFARAAAEMMGRSRVFAAATTIVAIWLLLGPMFGFSDTWQLTMNTIAG